MEKNNTVALVVLVLSLMLLFSDKGIMQSAYAVTVASYTINANAATAGYGYYQNSDYILAYDNEGGCTATCIIVLADASDGSIINSYNNIVALSGTLEDSDLISCSTTIPYCFFIGTTSGSDVAIQALRITSPFTVTTYNNGTTYNNCGNGGLVISANTIIAQMRGCTNASFRGIWTIDINNLLDGIAGNNNQMISVVSNIGQYEDLCYDSVTSHYYARTSTTLVSKISPSTFAITTTLDVTNTISDMICDGQGYAIVASSASNIIKVVNLSTMTATANTAINNVFRTVRHAESVYVSTTASTALTVFAFNATGAMTQTGTVTGIATSALLIKANATRINAMNNVGGGSAQILYVIGDLANDGSEPEPEDNGGNQIDGICGVGTALDCVGDRSTINQITGAQNFTTVIGNLGTQLGLLNTTSNSDPETNGSGLILMLATGALFSSVTISAIAVANNKFGANIQYTQIPKEYWLFLVIGVVALAWYLNWIPDIIFYGMIVGLAGLFAFGLYRQFNGNGG